MKTNVDIVDNVNLPSNVRYAAARQRIEASTLTPKEKRRLLKQVGLGLGGTLIPPVNRDREQWLFPDATRAIFNTYTKIQPETQMNLALRRAAYAA